LRKAICPLVFGVILAITCIAPAGAGSRCPKVVADASYVQGLVEAPVPNYPEQAVQKAWSGIGVFEIRFRPDGTVANVIVELTTGYNLLDDTARASLLRWRCKPGPASDGRMTMSFTTGRGLVEVQPEDEPEAKKHGNLTQASRPLYPYEARRQQWGGHGVFVIRFERDGSASKVVTLKSTGHIILDSECKNTLLHWRCRPGVYDTVLVPINFTLAGGMRRAR
jgi:TonB family protein